MCEHCLLKAQQNIKEFVAMGNRLFCDVKFVSTISKSRLYILKLARQKKYYSLVKYA